MVKKFNQNQVERLLDLVPYLISNQGVALEKIASDFRTDKSTVIDDLNTLWMCGLPGYTPLELIDLSFDTGFVTIRNAEVLSQPRKLSNIEMATIIVGLHILKESIELVSPHFESISNLLARLGSTSTVPVPESVYSNISPEIKSVCSKAVKQTSDLSIVYHSYARDEETKRRIFPFGFQVIDGHEYLQGFCHESSGVRLFRMDRIKSAEIIGSSQFIRTDSEIADVSRSFQIQVRSESRKVSETFHIAIPSDYSQESFFDATAFNDEWIIRAICSLNSAATLTSPLDLRNQIAERAKRAVALYE